MNGARQHGLAGSTLTEEEHRGIRRCDLMNLLDDLPHPRRGADQTLDALHLFKLGLEVAVLFLQRPPSDEPRDSVSQLVNKTA